MGDQLWRRTPTAGYAPERGFEPRMLEPKRLAKSDDQKIEKAQIRIWASGVSKTDSVRESLHKSVLRLQSRRLHWHFVFFGDSIFCFFVFSTKSQKNTRKPTKSTHSCGIDIFLRNRRNTTEFTIIRRKNSEGAFGREFPMVR